MTNAHVLDDTIVALATPLGRSSIAVLRLSGPQSLSIACSLSQKQKQQFETHKVQFCSKLLFEHKAIDEAMLLWMQAPHSYTGQDVLEISTHGNPLIVQKLIDACIALGARMAEPGEFTKRAFLNGKKDLLQAEAVADLIDAQTDRAMQASLRQISGNFSVAIEQVLKDVEDLMVHLEAELDFQEDEIHFLGQDNFQNTVQAIEGALENLKNNYERSEIYRQGLRVLIMGLPNAGKSSLYNCLIGDSKAIVTDIPGTTRDALEAMVDLQGIPLCFIDTAGLRDSSDLIEQEGVKRAKQFVQSVHGVLFVIDGQQCLEQKAQLEQQLEELNSIAPKDLWIQVLLNKSDLYDLQSIQSQWPELSFIGLSTKTGDGLAELEQTLLTSLVPEEGQDSYDFMLNERHKKLIDQALNNLAQLRDLILQSNQELATFELRNIHQFLRDILGQNIEPDILGKIFQNFCIGK